MKNIITKREKEIFQLLIENKSTKEISNILNQIDNFTDNTNRSNAIIELLKLNEISIKN